MTDQPLSRRRFLGRLGTGAVALAGTNVLSVWQGSERVAASTRLRAGDLGARAGDRTLVVLELGGGNDALSTVVPYTNAEYRRLRPTLGVANPIDLDGEVGLHPNVAKLAERYKAGHVAIVEGLGYESPDLSHFGSSAVWWTARGGAGGGGWIGAYLDGTVGFDDPLAAIGIGPSPSPALLGGGSFATTISDDSGLTPVLPPWADDVDSLLAAWSDFAPARIDPDDVVGEVRRAVGLTDTARHDLDRALGTSTNGSSSEPSPYEETSVSDSLALAARLIKSQARPQVVYVNALGDYDTHQGQADRHPELLAQLDAGIETLFTTLGERADKVVVMTVSEFGRRPAENGSGTDHGTANTHFVIGPKVKGGRYGEPPSLTDLDQTRNLRHTADFRSLYATVLSGWLDVDPKPILGEKLDTFPVF